MFVLLWKIKAIGADVKIMDRFFRHRELPDSENFSKPGFQLKTAWFLGVFVGGTVYGKVLLDQTIALDLRARHVTDETIVDHVSREELEEIITLYKLLFSIDDK